MFHIISTQSHLPLILIIFRLFICLSPTWSQNFVNFTFLSPYSCLFLGGIKDKKYDYAAAFNMFDEGGKGAISVEALKHMMIRLQLITQIADRLRT